MNVWIQELKTLHDAFMRLLVIVTRHATLCSLGYICASLWQTITRCGLSCRFGKLVAPTNGIGSSKPFHCSRLHLDSFSICLARSLDLAQVHALQPERHITSKLLGAEL